MLITFLWFYFIFIDYLNGSNSYQCFKSKNLNQDQCNQCDFGSECILSNRNVRNVTCKCIENCYSYGDSIDSREGKSVIIYIYRLIMIIICNFFETKKNSLLI